MISPLRKMHRLGWFVLPPVIGLLLFFALRDRKAMPVMENVPAIEQSAGESR
jgi:hypothetical protein